MEGENSGERKGIKGSSGKSREKTNRRGKEKENLGCIQEGEREGRDKSGATQVDLLHL